MGFSGFSKKVHPSSLSVLMFLCTAGLLYIRGLQLIENATGQSALKILEVNKLSPIPQAALLMVLAVAGATRKRSVFSFFVLEHKLWEVPFDSKE